MIKQFLLFCSGSSLEILNKEECLHEHNKYVGIGSAVFFTSLFAFISSSYALYTVFESYLVSIVLGVVWALFIFSLDRYIVATLKKEEENENTSWASAKLTEVLKASPRIALAILLGLLISKPLELKLFEREIEVELIMLQQRKLKEQETELMARYTTNIERRGNEIQTLEAQISDAREKFTRLQRLAQEEADGTGGSGRPNLGPIYRTKKADAEQAYAVYESVEKRNRPTIDKYLSENLKDEGAIQRERQGFETKEFNGLLARLSALGSLGEHDETAASTITAVNWLFIMFELVPLLFKILTDRGPYEIIVSTQEEVVRAQELELISKVNDEVNKRIQMKVTETQDVADQESSDNKALMKKISGAQLEIAEEIISHWKGKELEKIRENPSRYIGGLKS
jgi:hypothetical protein